MSSFGVYSSRSNTLSFVLLTVSLLAAALSLLAQQGVEMGSITGTVVDIRGDAIGNAVVRLSLPGCAADQETLTAETGSFSFFNVSSGPHQLSFAANGFSPKTIHGELPAAGSLNLPQTVLALATHNTNITVGENQAEVAQAEIKEAEQQRLFGLVPNYFVTYNPDPTPLNIRQKFELTRKTFLDPAAFVITGIIAGAGQSQNRYPGFAQGAQGYAKRYGASYANYVTGAVLERVVLTTVFKQDPRYFYKGTGSTRSRVFYAISRSVICQNDNKKAEFCYSSVIGHFAAGALTNYYYPAADRNSPGVTVENAAIGIGARAIANLVQEFVARKLTSKKP